MKPLPHSDSYRPASWRGSPMRWLVVLSGLVLILAAFFRPRRPSDSDGQREAATTPGVATASTHSGSPDRSFSRLAARSSASKSEPTATEIVSNKVAQFTRQRREVLETMARNLKAEVPVEVLQFFQAAEAGNWVETDARFKALTQSKTNQTSAAETIARLWPAILDTYGVAEQAHNWPAQKLLDYGHAVLDALRPGMVYVGGTDEGRWVPELLNDTSDGERHVILTQNGLADGSYLSFLATLYGGRMNTLTQEDSEKAFQEYLADAQRRLQHDQEFPGEPKQIRPGEDIQLKENRVQVGGQVAVMSINEKLLQVLMQKNPDLSFALQESFPLTGTYGNAAPLGPIMELGVQDVQSAFTPERAAQSLDYWRGLAQQLAADPETAGSPDILQSYSKLATGQANLFADHQYLAEAEQAYRLSNQLWPGNFEPVSGLAELMLRTGRADEAQTLMDNFERQFPKQKSDLEKARARWQFISSSSGTPPHP